MSQQTDHFRNTPDARSTGQDLKLPELSQSQRDLISSRLHREEQNLRNYRHLFNNLAQQVFELHRANPFSSIVSDEASGRFVTVFLRKVLRSNSALPVVCVDPGRDLSEAFAQNELRRHLGSRPLLATEAIYSGKACVHIVTALREIGLSPVVAALFMTEARGVSSNAAAHKILQAGAAKVISGGTMGTFEQGIFFRNPALCGLVSVKDKTAGTKVLKPWYKSEQDSELCPQSKQVILNSARSLLREIAEEFKRAQH